MIIKKVQKLILLSSIALIGTGCSYKLSTTEEFKNLDNRLVSLENNISKRLSEEIDRGQKCQKKYIESLYSASEAEHNRTVKSLQGEIDELKSLVKSQEQCRVQRDIKTPKKRAPKVATLTNKIEKSSKEKLIVGRVERVRINPPGIVMEARIDTGAQTSSINAKDITRFERDGSKWVRFALIDEKTNESHIIERRVVRVAKILQSSLDDGFERRVVVMLQITVGNKKLLSEFTLTSRDHMTYSVLVGRSLLQDLMVVDVGGRYLAPLKQEEKKDLK